MRQQYIWISIIFLTLVLVPHGMALTGKDIIITPSKPWVTANGVDSTSVFVVVTNVTHPRSVDFSLDDTRYGSIAPIHFDPVLNTNFLAYFTAATASGEVRVRVTVTEQGMPAATNETILYLDHTAPAGIHHVAFTPEAEAGTPIGIQVLMEDIYGNIIDARREIFEGRAAEKVQFIAGSTGGNAYFGTAGVTITTAKVDATGNASTVLTVDTLAGPNWVRIEPPAPLPPFPITITGTGADPTGISQTFSPAGSPCPQIPADGYSVFTIAYILNDRWGNPSPGRTVRITTSLGETRELSTNTDGQVMINYGPKFSVGPVTITATSLENASVYCSQIVIFTATAPTSMLLTASPQTMPSLDVNETISAEVRAKVIDLTGYPVANQTVYFEIIHSAFYPSCQTTPPGLSAASAVTDEDGFATVQFFPGRFITSGPGYNPQAFANCTVRATWSTDTAPVMLTWMNFPYLSVETIAYPPTIPVNGTTNITVRLRGDGWALHSVPIEVVLCTDRSGSMLYDNPDRMERVRCATYQFVDQMSVRDAVGLVSFGRNGYISRPGVNSGISTGEINNAYPGAPRTYGDYATVDRTLSNSYVLVKSDLALMVPDHGTPMRSAVYKSINEIQAHGHASGTVRAIVLLSDGDYNWYGDPLARGTGSTTSPTGFTDLTSSYYAFTGLGSGKFSNQNMSVYAKNRNVRIYAIGYADQISSGGRNTLSILAQGSGGKYYNGTAGNIEGVYRAIAGDLKSSAGINTTMDCVFTDISVNNVTVPGAEVFQYLYVPGKSTYEKSYNATLNPWPGSENLFDQTDEWNAGHRLHYNVGTIVLGQIWEVNFQLRAIKEGNINVFGSGSVITFNNGTSTLALPDTYVSAYPPQNITIPTAPVLHIEVPPGVVNTNNATVVEFMDFAWWTTYNGDFSYNETIVYQYRNPQTGTWGPEVAIDSQGPKTNGTWIPGTARLDVRTLPQGIYRITVRAVAADGAQDQRVVDLPITDTRSYISLK